VVSANGAYSPDVYNTICGTNMEGCIDAFLIVCNSTSELFDTIREPTISSNYWDFKLWGERKILIP
jgi:hypothetical protein